MDSKTENNLLAYLILIIAALTVLCLIATAVFAIVKIADRAPETETEAPTESDTDSTPTQVSPQLVTMAETPDAGMEYIDSMIFFGESTTAHLRARGVLSGGTSTRQVWADASGTRMLSSRTTSEPITYPETGEALTIAEACERAKPEYLVLSFGLNGITGFVANKTSYVNSYNKLINAVKQASPNTKIILQTVYPVCRADGFTVDTATLNAHIQMLNSWLPEIAAAHENVRVADTASVLYNSEGMLAASFDNGDGIHLTRSAYEEILAYLRTHAWQ